MQDFELEPFAMGADHSQMVKAAPIANGYSSKDCVNLLPSTAVSRFKVIYLDIGLCQAILGSDISIWFLRPLEGFENRGEITEGFIGQELICYANPDNKADLYFWKRKGKNSLAEVDYLIQRGEWILPIEVKSGHGNTLRSLHMFLETHPKSPSAVRFSSLNYSVMDKLDTRPLYAAASLAHPNQKEALEVIPKL